ncbi:MAG: hypothetical protein BWY04_01384 [candidate division CPR1 bacterium ADurb.Bin160]|uniref:Uncharacterized protein n=1 Tax=candidate division CPR1 bacterium ADurb.Bin160 TaxID=1852826 RepID=A0A1V5ZJC4_9BACT|nr:MAG: hypothetical protein BWY04_01384 [candidate division CPR1 bacterium ADurb.Bin160]
MRKTIYLNFPKFMNPKEYETYFKNLYNLGLKPALDNNDDFNFTKAFSTYESYINICKQKVISPLEFEEPKFIVCISFDNKTFFITKQNKEIVMTFPEFLNYINTNNSIGIKMEICG